MERRYSFPSIHFATGIGATSHYFRIARKEGTLTAMKVAGCWSMSTADVSAWLIRIGKVRQVDIWILERLLNMAADIEASKPRPLTAHPPAQKKLDKETGHDTRY